MTHSYERNIVEIKTEYTDCLCDILIPLLYEGIKAVYKSAILISDKLENGSRFDPNIRNPGVLKIFQGCLKDIPTLNRNSLEVETSRIKEAGKCADWFDDLVKSVVKSYIILLTFKASGKKCKLIDERFHERVDTCEFIHKCYIECARVFFNNPELFWTNYDKNELQRNMNRSHEYIRMAIREAIRKIIPMKSILQEYLKHDYIDDVDLEGDHPKINRDQVHHHIKEDIISDKLRLPHQQYKILESSHKKYSEHSHQSHQSLHGKELLESSRESSSDSPSKESKSESHKHDEKHEYDDREHIFKPSSTHNHPDSDKHKDKHNGKSKSEIKSDKVNSTKFHITNPTLQNMNPQIPTIIPTANLYPFKNMPLDQQQIPSNLINPANNPVISTIPPLSLPLQTLGQESKYIQSPYPIRKSIVKSFNDELKTNLTQEKNDFFDQLVNK